MSYNERNKYHANHQSTQHNRIPCFPPPESDQGVRAGGIIINAKISLFGEALKGV